MTYTFELDRDYGTWTAYNADGQEIDTGQLPLTDTRRKIAIIQDKGVSNPTAEALEAIMGKDWETETR
jgi:hypothetical protein